MRRLSTMLFVISFVVAPVVAHADDKTKGAVDGALKTGADAVVDTARTLGRSPRASRRLGGP